MKHSNQIFTPFGLTDKYDVLVGIDQREVICPLLWYIYYDPLLSYILSRLSSTLLGHKSPDFFSVPRCGF